MYFFQRIRLALLFWSVAAVALGQSAGVKAASTEAPAEVAIFYDGPKEPLSEGFLDANHIANLLGHFGLRGEIIPIANYRAGQLSRYRAAFFVGSITGTRFPAGFLADVRGSRQPFCWIGRHIGELVNPPEGRQFGFSYVDYRDDLEFRQVTYKGVTLPKEDPDLNIVSVNDANAVQVLATATNDEKATHPYALRRNRFWYIADTPFSYSTEGDRYLAFCDLLHDILEMDHPPQARAMVRIEDVSAEIDPADLRQVADVLAARRIPYQIAVVPVFRNPSKGFEIYMSDRPRLVDAIRYMIGRGGTPVLHGVTHQYRGASGDDYEFWDEIGGRPIARDSAALVLDRLQLGLAECFTNGIFPVAFETPHYGASATDYQAMKQVFTLFNERTMATPDVGSIQYFPYPVVDRFGRYVVPENLGYLPLDSPDPKVIVERARNMRVVRDALASFYFHPFLDPALLGEIVRGMTDAGYRFVSLREFGGAVDLQGRYLVRTSAGPASVSPHDEFWRLRTYDRSGRMLSERVSASRQNGSVQVELQPPPGGWAAIECVKDAPKPSRAQDWKLAMDRWWSRWRPARRVLASGGDFAATGKAWIFWVEKPDTAAANNQQSYRSLFETLGYQVTAIAAGQPSWPSLPLASRTIVVVPQAAGARLSSTQQQEILRYVAAGGLLVADGRQPWLEAVGLRWASRRIPVSTVVDVLFPEMSLRWQPAEEVERFTAPEGAQELMVDPESRQVLALSAAYGSGRFIHLAAPLDPHTPHATSHYPYFAEYLYEGFRLRQPPRSPRLEVYFDPSYREGTNLDRLAASWRQAGIRAVYAAAWQFYREYSFDYARLASACHRNGIAVYAWFVFPAVTQKMWEERPEWRERTASGADGRVGWRYSMNFQNPACFREAMEWAKGLLAAHPWDGINITELNFDADLADYLRPDRFVPMNDDVRAEFRERAGFDPTLLFAPGSEYYHKRNPEALQKFLRYRQDVVTGWHERVLEALAPLARERGSEIIVTMLDSLHSGFVERALGVDSRRIVGLMKRFDFTLQVEDPAEHWVAPPDRYLRFAADYRKLVADPRRLMFDINVVPDRSVAGTTLPSATATGTELARTVLAAASVSGRAAIYSEYTVPSQDWRLLSTALASQASMEPGEGGWKLQAPVPVLLSSSEDRDYYLDGRRWPAVSSEGILAPAGAHLLSSERPGLALFEKRELPTRLLHLSGEIIDARARSTGLEVRYRSPGRAVILLSQRPREVFVDGRRAEVVSEPAGGGNWALVVPRGEHQLAIETLTRAGVVVNSWSWLSASAIAGFGALTTALMVAIYLQMRMRRPARRGGAS